MKEFNDAQPNRLLGEAARGLLAQAGAVDPDWEAVVALAVAILRTAGAQIHDSGGRLVLETLEDERHRHDSELRDQIGQAIQAATMSLETAQVTVTRILMIVEGFDSGTDDFRAILGSPDEQRDDLLTLLGYAYARFGAMTADEPSSN